MANIKKYVALKDYNKIAKEIRSMKRLWLDKNMKGLVKRREDEAILVQKCLTV